MNCELLIIINDGDSLLVTGEIIREAIYCPIKGKLIKTILLQCFWSIWKVIIF